MKTPLQQARRLGACLLDMTEQGRLQQQSLSSMQSIPERSQEFVKEMEHCLLLLLLLLPQVVPNELLLGRQGLDVIRPPLWLHQLLVVRDAGVTRYVINRDVSYEIV